MAIARFRLLIAALRASGERHLAEAPNFRFHLAAGDSLLHGPRKAWVVGKQADIREMFDTAEDFHGTVLEHAYAVEDLDELNRILGQRYHAVVGNPPYITVKDAALNKTYRERYGSCHMKYSLGVPFTERFFGLALTPHLGPSPQGRALTPGPSPQGERGGFMEQVVPQGERGGFMEQVVPQGEKGGFMEHTSPHEERGEGVEHVAPEGDLLAPSPPRGEGRDEGLKSFKTRTIPELSPLLTEFAREMRHAPTDAEGRLWYFLRNRRMAGHKFRRQHQIGPYIVDFVCVDARLVIEVDGGQHGDDDGLGKDQTRDGFLRERGLEVLRFWNNEVLANTEAVLERIWWALENSAPHPRPLSPRGRGEKDEEHLLSPSPLGERGWGEGPLGESAARGRGWGEDSTAGREAGGEGAGYIGMITANSFMKREFGKKLIEQFLPGVDLTHVIDTSGTYIPGHGTPTVILFGRNRQPVGGTVRTVMGIKGEPVTPADPAQGLVWSAIVGQVDLVGSESAYVSVADTPRQTFGRHPWSIGGGGAADLKEVIEEGRMRLEMVAAEIGITGVTGEDELFILGDTSTAKRLGIEQTRPLVTGDLVRDYSAESLASVWLYDKNYGLQSLADLPQTNRLFWSYRSNINKRKRFGTSMVERGLTWYEWQELYVSKLRTPLSITFGEVATHNHFVLDRGGKVFNRTAPVIKLPAGASEDEHLALLGLLNSSVACFWLKQVCFPKGGDHVGSEGARVRRTQWDERYAFNATNVSEFPLPDLTPHPNPLPSGEREESRGNWGQRENAAEAGRNPPLSPAGRGAGGEGLPTVRGEAERLGDLAGGGATLAQVPLADPTPHPGPLPSGEREKNVGENGNPEENANSEKLGEKSPLSPWGERSEGPGVRALAWGERSEGPRSGAEGLLDLARRLDQLAQERAACLPAMLLAQAAEE